MRIILMKQYAVHNVVVYLLYYNKNKDVHEISEASLSGIINNKYNPCLATQYTHTKQHVMFASLNHNQYLYRIKELSPIVVIMRNSLFNFYFNLISS